jgi:hypothetical protein
MKAKSRIYIKVNLEFIYLNYKIIIALNLDSQALENLIKKECALERASDKKSAAKTIHLDFE